MKKLIITTLLAIVVGTAQAVEYRERDHIIPGNNPVGCNTIVHVVERFESGFWVTESFTVTFDSCNGGGGWVE